MKPMNLLHTNMKESPEEREERKQKEKERRNARRNKRPAPIQEPQDY
jgi:hypothetical protein